MPGEPPELEEPEELEELEEPEEPEELEEPDCDGVVSELANDVADPKLTLKLHG